MMLTRDHSETIRELAQGDPEFRSALLDECVDCVRTGDAATAKSMLTHYVAATVGFDEAVDIGFSPDGLRRALDPDGDAPDADALAVIAALREREGAPSLAVPAGAQP